MRGYKDLYEITDPFEDEDIFLLTDYEVRKYSLLLKIFREVEDAAIPIPNYWSWNRKNMSEEFWFEIKDKFGKEKE